MAVKTAYILIYHRNEKNISLNFNFLQNTQL